MTNTRNNTNAITVILKAYFSFSFTNDASREKTAENITAEIISTDEVKFTENALA